MIEKLSPIPLFEKAGKYLVDLVLGTAEEFEFTGSTDPESEEV